MWNNTQHKSNIVPQCSFCGQSRNQANRLIEGPVNTYICHDCVAAFRDSIDELHAEGRTMENIIQTCRSCGIRCPANYHYCFNCGTQFSQTT